MLLNESNINTCSDLFTIYRIFSRELLERDLGELTFLDDRPNLPMGNGNWKRKKFEKEILL